jgi:hypothetical protein
MKQSQDMLKDGLRGSRHACRSCNVGRRSLCVGVCIVGKGGFVGAWRLQAVPCVGGCIVGNGHVRCGAFYIGANLNVVVRGCRWRWLCSSADSSELMAGKRSWHPSACLG